jgi:hypothetical protein
MQDLLRRTKNLLDGWADHHSGKPTPPEPAYPDIDDYDSGACDAYQHAARILTNLVELPTSADIELFLESEESLLREARLEAANAEDQEDEDEDEADED